MRNGLELSPRRHESHDGDKYGRNAHQLHEEPDRVAPAIRRYQAVEPRQVVVRNGRTAVGDNERRLVQRKLLDGETAIRRLEARAAPEGTPNTNAGPPASLKTASISSA